MKVSVIMPTAGVGQESRLKKAVADLCGQTFREWECLILAEPPRLEVPSFVLPAGPSVTVFYVAWPHRDCSLNYGMELLRECGSDSEWVWFVPDLARWPEKLPPRTLELLMAEATRPQDTMLWASDYFGHVCARLVRRSGVIEWEPGDLPDDRVYWARYFGSWHRMVPVEPQGDPVADQSVGAKLDADWTEGTYHRHLNRAIDRRWDWLEDFEHENGRYYSRCHNCQTVFVGHKRRFICRECAT